MAAPLAAEWKRPHKSASVTSSLAHNDWCWLQAYLVLRGRGKGDDTATMAKPQAAKFLTKAKTNNSQHVTP